MLIIKAGSQWWSLDLQGQGHDPQGQAKAKDLTCHAALKPQTLYTVQC